MRRYLTCVGCATLLLAGLAGACGSQSGTGDDGGGAGDARGFDFGQTDDGRPADGRDATTRADQPLPDAPPADQAGRGDAPPAGDAVCAAGEFRCGSPTMVQQCADGQWTLATLCATGEVCVDSACRLDVGCQPGEVFSCANERTVRRCHEEGHVWVEEPCPEGQFCYNGSCQTMLCVPNSVRCIDLSNVEICNETGDAWDPFQQCAEGAVCKDGACVSGCEDSMKLFSYIGCEYWSVDLDNYPDPFTDPMPNEVPHAVVISNPNNVPATIQFFTINGIDIPPREVPAHSAMAIEMPRMDVDGSVISNNAIRVLSNWPVVAYQFNPFNNMMVYSNDASLLLPVNVLGREYWILTQPGSPSAMGFTGQRSYFTVVAVQPGTTEVTVTVSEATSPGENLPAMTRGETRTFQLEQFQVLNLEATDRMTFGEGALDMSGSHVLADKPVAVFSGHEESVIGTSQCADACCAEHLEEQNFPVNTWDTEVLCAKSHLRGGPGELEIWRVQAAYDGTRITTDPPIPGLDGQTLNAGKYIQVETPESFEIVATAPIQVAQFFIGQNCTDQFVGDPSMVLAVPTAQFRDDYTLLVPENYDTNWVTIVRPPGVDIFVDDAPVAAPFTAFASGLWEVGYVLLQPGVHRIQAAWAFGVYLYGWDAAVSYGLPGGLDLKASSWAPGR